MVDFEMKRGDTAPSMVVVLRDSAGAPVDLSLASGVQFTMRAAAASPGVTPAVSAVATVAADQTADRGKVTYDWVLGDTDTAGLFNAECVVTWATGSREQTYPTSGFITVLINEDLEAHAVAMAAQQRALAAQAVTAAAVPRGIDTTASAAEATIRRKIAASSAPLLQDADIAALVAMALRADGTYVTNRAAAEGWRWKMALVAGGFSFSADGVQVDKTMLLEHCRKMSVMFSRNQVRSIRVDTQTGVYEQLWFQPS